MRWRWVFLMALLLSAAMPDLARADHFGANFIVSQNNIDPKWEDQIHCSCTLRGTRSAIYADTGMTLPDTNYALVSVHVERYGVQSSGAIHSGFGKTKNRSFGSCGNSLENQATRSYWLYYVRDGTGTIHCGWLATVSNETNTYMVQRRDGCSGCWGSHINGSLKLAANINAAEADAVWAGMQMNDASEGDGNTAVYGGYGFESATNWQRTDDICCGSTTWNTIGTSHCANSVIQGTFRFVVGRPVSAGFPVFFRLSPPGACN